MVDPTGHNPDWLNAALEEAVKNAHVTPYFLKDYLPRITSYNVCYTKLLRLSCQVHGRVLQYGLHGHAPDCARRLC